MVKLFFSVTLVGALMASVASGQTSASFAEVGSMNSPRLDHTATLLGNGKVLVTGGLTPWGDANTAEMFDPATGTFAPPSPNRMTLARRNHTATLLPSGKVLIAGGSGEVNTAELFDPASGTFTPLAPMISPRAQHTATLLRDGRILIAGGWTEDGPTNTAELFDPASGTFTSLSPGTMTAARVGHTATLLPSGKVLMAGGYDGNAWAYTNTAELFDPASGTFTLVPNTMTSVRVIHTATLLPTGKVLIAGGSNGDLSLNTAEIFDPSLGVFTTAIPMTAPRERHTATLLPNGKVLIAAGYTLPLVAPAGHSVIPHGNSPEGHQPPGTGPNDTAELFDPASQTFISLLPNKLTSARFAHSAVLLSSGKVLIIGGQTHRYLNTAEQFDPASATFTPLIPNTMTSPRWGQTATLLPTGKVLIAGGAAGPRDVFGVPTLVTNTAELFDPASGTFAPVANAMSVPRVQHTATLLPDGKVLIAGGHSGDTPFPGMDTAELFDPASATFTSIFAMTSARAQHTATLLPSGKVLIAGGWDPVTTALLNTAELFDPVSRTFTLLPNVMTAVRVGHTATLLRDGKILMAGGSTNATPVGVTNTAELFDPVSGTFTSLSLSTMASVRWLHSATLLPNGKVLIAGGSNPFTDGIFKAAELFDPVSRTFTSILPMTAPREQHTATLLPSGKVFLAGGLAGGDTRPQTVSRVTNTAELFDPALGTFTKVSNTMTSERYAHTATLLANGNILIAGGYTNGDPTNTADLFNDDLGFSDSRRPIVSATSDPVAQPASLVLTGTGFRGDSEASGGSSINSATDYPVVQLMRIDNEQVFFPLSHPATSWSDTQFTSEVLGAATLLPSGSYRLTVFTNAVPSLQKVINITSSTPVQLSSVVSRKVHGSAGAFDVDLPLAGNPGIECRSGGSNSEHRIVITFPVPVSIASVTTTCGTISDSNTTDTVTTLDLSGVPNATRCTLTLHGVNDGTTSNDVTIPAAFLAGDTNADGFVNSADISQTKSQSGNAVTTSNFREDLTTDGFLNSADISLAKSKSGTALP